MAGSLTRSLSLSHIFEHLNYVLNAGEIFMIGVRFYTMLGMILKQLLRKHFIEKKSQYDPNSTNNYIANTCLSF